MTNRDAIAKLIAPSLLAALVASSACQAAKSSTVQSGASQTAVAGSDARDSAGAAGTGGTEATAGAHAGSAGLPVAAGGNVGNAGGQAGSGGSSGELNIPCTSECDCPNPCLACHDDHCVGVPGMCGANNDYAICDPLKTPFQKNCACTGGTCRGWCCVKPDGGVAAGPSDPICQ